MNKLIRITTVPLSLDKLLDKQMAFMKDYYKVIAVSSNESFLKKIGEKDGVDTYCVEMTRKITPFQDVKAIWKLYYFLKREKPLFVHTHTPKAGMVGMVAALLAKVPNRLHTVAGLPLMETKGLKRKVLSLVEKMTYKCSTIIYSNSKGLRDIIIKEKLCPEKKIRIIGNGSSNGINTSYFDPINISTLERADLKESLNIDSDDFVFIFVGRLVTDKGINELISVFDNVSRRNIKVKLLLVGNREPELDPLKKETLELISKNSNIIEVGYQSDVRPYFAISDVLVFPSYREGFPNVVMQAGAMGLPSIVTDINGCNEIIINDTNGVIIPPKNSLELQRTMELYLNNNGLLAEHRANSRKMIVSRYQQEVIWRTLLSEYKSLE
ncbi:Capsular polysaccharide biosynthesis glycosyl transferase [uncultured Dysgonomonas sp.]|uniref:Capsular polysaccharide biosynthesis glycosyl transferase n=1 Tax=uncultured Dysgonomonas sp. TaxID=206096 RepID=A0A212J4R3_9BACT|nr:glycosyltransferase family 4 protein [uncultured Dysgonomonas sp.]SBV94364.1 Capsular polysaccharide biosynthesis glycosyl transferase [uncultured Dysgonomonas sp.]